jgi:hypothetical protein
MACDEFHRQLCRSGGPVTGRQSFKIGWKTRQKENEKVKKKKEKKKT